MSVFWHSVQIQWNPQILYFADAALGQQCYQWAIFAELIINKKISRLQMIWITLDIITWPRDRRDPIRFNWNVHISVHFADCGRLLTYITTRSSDDRVWSSRAVYACLFRLKNHIHGRTNITNRHNKRTLLCFSVHLRCLRHDGYNAQIRLSFVSVIFFLYSVSLSLSFSYTQYSVWIE